MPDCNAAPATDKSPDKNIDDSADDAEIDISSGPGARERAVDLRGSQLRNDGRQLPTLWKEDPKDWRENTDFVEAPLRRELRPGAPDPIKHEDAMGEIEIRVQQIGG